MQGHEGFIAIFSDGDWTGTTFSNPQLLYADSESLTAGKNLNQKPFQVSNSRVRGTGCIISGPVKPEGDITWQFRSDDAAKVIMSHFQMGTQYNDDSDGTTNFQYAFYPTRATPDYYSNDDYGNGSYNSGTGYVFSVSILKKYVNTSSYGGTNAMFFKHGICNKLKISLDAEKDARMTASFKFRDLDYGTAVAGTVGSYSALKAYQGWSATALMDGTALDITGLSFVSNNGIEEKSRLGRLNPESFSFGEYTLKGALTLDLPKDAMRFVGSMFTQRPFSVIATLYNGTNDQMVFEAPHCKYQPFDFNLTGGEDSITGAIPFQGFAVGGYPFRITVNTDYAFEGFREILDAWNGVRSLPDFEDYDSENGARVLSDYEILDRDT